MSIRTGISYFSPISMISILSWKFFFTRLPLILTSILYFFNNSIPLIVLSNPSFIWHRFSYVSFFDPYKVIFILLGLFFAKNSAHSSLINVPLVLSVRIIPISFNAQYNSLNCGNNKGSPPVNNKNNVPASFICFAREIHSSKLRNLPWDCISCLDKWT